LVDRNLNLDSVLSSLYVNPDVIAADKQIRINELAQSEIYALRYPNISVSGQYNFNRSKNAAGSILLNQNYGPYLGVTLGLPIYNGSVYKKQYQIADINTNTSRLLKDTLVQNYNSLAVKTWQAYVSNIKQLETQQKNYELSLQLLDLVMQRFQLRQATILDVKNAQQTFENAAYALTNIAYAAKVSEIQLRKLENRLVF
jgi:Outer membrane protein